VSARVIPRTKLSAVRGSPFEKRARGRRWKVNLVLSGLVSHDMAMPGTTAAVVSS